MESIRQQYLSRRSKEYGELVKGLDLQQDEFLVFLSHHKDGAGHQARILKDRLASMLNLESNKVFLDKDQLILDLNELARYVRKSRVLILLLSEKTFERPFIIGEVVAAISAGIPVIPIEIRDSGYNFGKTSALLQADDFYAKLEETSPGSGEALRKLNFDVFVAGKLLKSTIPSLIPIVELDLKNAPPKVLDAQIETIADAILAAKRKETAGGVFGSEGEGSQYKLLRKAIAENSITKLIKNAAIDDEAVFCAFCAIVVEYGTAEQLQPTKDKQPITIKALIAEGAVEVILEGLKSWGVNQRDTSTRALRALTCLLEARANQGLSRFCNSHGCDIVHQNFRTWAVQDAGFAATAAPIMRILTSAWDAEAKLIAIGIAADLVKTLRKWKSEPGIVIPMSLAIGNFAKHYQAQNQLGEAGVCADLVKLLSDQGMSDHEVATAVMYALRKMATSTMLGDISVMTQSSIPSRLVTAAGFGQWRAALGLAGACEAVTDILQTWGPEERQIALYGLSATKYLALDPTNADKLGQAGICNILVKLLEIYGSTDAEIAKQGCAAAICLTAEKPNLNAKMLEADPKEIVTNLRIKWNLSFTPATMLPSVPDTIRDGVDALRSRVFGAAVVQKTRAAAGLSTATTDSQERSASSTGVGNSTED